MRSSQAELRPGGVQWIVLCTIGHIIDGVCWHVFRPSFYHVWKNDFFVMSRLRFSWPIHCVADYCELAVCNGDSFNFSLTVEPDVEIRHDAITVQAKTDSSSARIGFRHQSCWYGIAGDRIRTNLIVILFLVQSLCFQLIPILASIITNLTGDTIWPFLRCPFMLFWYSIIGNRLSNIASPCMKKYINENDSGGIRTLHFSRERAESLTVRPRSHIMF